MPISLTKFANFFRANFFLTVCKRKAIMKKIKTLKNRNPFATAMMLRHGGGVKRHKDKTKYTRKTKHKGKNNELP